MYVQKKVLIFFLEKWPRFGEKRIYDLEGNCFGSKILLKYSLSSSIVCIVYIWAEYVTYLYNANKLFGYVAITRKEIQTLKKRAARRKYSNMKTIARGEKRGWTKALENGKGKKKKILDK